MISIDDSGSGSLIGGTCIGIYDTASLGYYFEVIPPELYREPHFKKKNYQDYVIEIVKRAFEHFNIVDTSTPIEICRGYMFDRLRIWFNLNNYNWRNTEIKGILQEMVEKSFEDYAVSMGFPYQYIKYTKYPFHFHRILRWVYADYDKRSKLCKTGWKSWKKFGMLDLDITSDYIKDGKLYHCLKCGRLLDNKKRVKVIRYNANFPNIIYVHVKCTSKCQNADLNGSLCYN